MTATDQEINAALDLLRANGFIVTKPRLGEAETPAQFCARLGFHVGSLARAIARGARRGTLPPADISRGPSGRILSIRSTAEFDAWFTRSSSQRSTLNHQPLQ